VPMSIYLNDQLDVPVVFLFKSLLHLLFTQVSSYL